jgi:hypothetical protein
LHRITLARNIDVRAERDVPVPFAPGHGGKASSTVHGSIVAQAAEKANGGTGGTRFALVALRWWPALSGCPSTCFLTLDRSGHHSTRSRDGCGLP